MDGGGRRAEPSDSGPFTARAAYSRRSSRCSRRPPSLLPSACRPGKAEPTEGAESALSGWRPTATIARTQRKSPVFIGVSVRTPRIRPRFHPRATAAHRPGHRHQLRAAGNRSASPVRLRCTRGRHPDAEPASPRRSQAPARTRIGNRAGRSGFAALVRGLSRFSLLRPRNAFDSFTRVARSSRRAGHLVQAARLHRADEAARPPRRSRSARGRPEERRWPGCAIPTPPNAYSCGAAGGSRGSRQNPPRRPRSRPAQRTMKESSPALPSIGPCRRYHQTDRTRQRGEDRPFPVSRAVTEYCDGTGSSSGGASRPPVRSPCPHPIRSPLTRPRAARKALSRRGCRPWVGREPRVIVAHDARHRREAEAAAARALPRANSATRPAAICPTWSGDAVSGLYRRTLDELARVLGVEAATVASNLPVERGLNLPLREAPGSRIAGSVDWRYVTGDYLRVLRIPLVAGRAFGKRTRVPKRPCGAGQRGVRHAPWRRADGDRRTAPDDGHRLRRPGARRWSACSATSGRAASPRPGRRCSYGQRSRRRTSLLGLTHGFFPVSWALRARADAAGLAPSVERILREVDRLLSITGFRSMDEVVGGAVAATRSARSCSACSPSPP